MRETRPSGSEAGETQNNGSSLPLSLHSMEGRNGGTRCVSCDGSGILLAQALDVELIVWVAGLV